MHDLGGNPIVKDEYDISPFKDLLRQFWLAAASVHSASARTGNQYVQESAENCQILEEHDLLQLQLCTSNIPEIVENDGGGNQKQQQDGCTKTGFVSKNQR